ncbi:hypothetical protein Btru_066194 [Bulinus truncatus]|nr:hypothetical protein Btru_066194 [Bulinus truncatus]
MGGNMEVVKFITFFELVTFTCDYDAIFCKGDNTTLREEDNLWNNTMPDVPGVVTERLKLTSTNVRATPHPSNLSASSTTSNIRTSSVTARSSTPSATGDETVAAKEMNYICKGQRSAFIHQTWYLYCELRKSWNKAKEVTVEVKACVSVLQKGIIDLYIGHRDDVSFWIGANDIDLDGNFVWSDTLTTVSSNLWAADYPITVYKTSDCGYVDRSQKLKNRRCFRKLNVVCHKSFSEPKWFDGGKSMCHCKQGSCDTGGECLNGVCQAGWFGPSCQFRNLDFDIADTGGILQDYDDHTCLVLTEPSPYIFPRAEYFTWMRIIMKESRSAAGFKIQLDADLDDQASYILIDNLTMDIRSSMTGEKLKRWSCTGLVLNPCVAFTYTELFMFGLHYEVGGTLISIINAHKTISRLQSKHGAKTKASFNSSYSTAVPAGSAVDGYHWNSGQCFKNWTVWTLQFHQDIEVYEVGLYRKMDSSRMTYAPHFAIKVDTVDDEETVSRTTTAPTTGPYVRVVSSEARYIRTVTILRDPEANGSVMSVCELVVFGGESNGTNS